MVCALELMAFVMVQLLVMQQLLMSLRLIALHLNLAL